MKKKDIKIKTPWYEMYDKIGMKKHLDYPDSSIYDLLVESANKYLENIAYNYYGKLVTYGNMLVQIEECAKGLKNIGVEEGDIVTLCLPNTPEAVILFYAINKVGGVVNLIHPLSGENEIKYYLNLTESKYLFFIDFTYEKIANIVIETKVENLVSITVKEYMPSLMKLGYMITKGRKVKKIPANHNVITWANFIANGKDYVKQTNACLKKDAYAVILYSGGTTGKSKGIVLSNYNFNALAISSIEACGCLKEKDSVLAIMPIFHGFGIGICIHTVFTFGGTSIILPSFSSKHFDKIIKKYKPNVIAGVPTLYEALLTNKHMDNVDLSFVKCAISGGDSLSVSLKKKIDIFFEEHNANITVREGYGLTECVTGTCLTPIDYYRESGIGIPYPDTYYKIVEPNTHNDLGYNEEGEIVISGPTIMVGYLNEESETNHALQRHEDGNIWLHTGDLGYMDNEGFIYFKQRLKRIIVTSGYNIYPQNIENVIDSHPSVLMSTVIGIPHPYKKQVAKAFIVLKNGIEPSNKLKEEILQHCKKSLSKYSLPYEIVFKEALPKTLVGKVAYRQLSEEEK
ncbi:MAG: AMP-binding protein [bacterium]|nr:AMP-binding protein [bacterium]